MVAPGLPETSFALRSPQLEHEDNIEERAADRERMVAAGHAMMANLDSFEGSG
jgi:hypothetical protein